MDGAFLKTNNMTSIEWLIEELNHCKEKSGFIEVTPTLLIRLGEQAKEMHNIELRKALEYGYDRGLEGDFTLEQEERFYQSIKQPKQ